MTALPDFVKQVNKPAYAYKYSVCTLVTRKEEYLQMLESFLQAGFDNSVCEYLVIDNSSDNLMDAYQGINSFLQKAAGEYLIICHQDILLTATSTRQLLEEQIENITKLDPTWAVLGNAGAANRLYNRLAIKIAYPNGFVDIKGQLPQQVGSIDENFMLVKNSANLSLSNNIGGYHLYGLDLCMVARMLGYSAYVIDFLLVHKSMGKVDTSFYDTLSTVKKKYTRFMQGRYMNTTIAKFYISGSAFKNALFNTRVFRRIIKTAEEIRTKLGKK